MSSAEKMRPHFLCLAQSAIEGTGRDFALWSCFEQSPKAMATTEEKDVRELAAYGIAEAAHYLLVPRATLRSWVAGMSYGSGSERKLFKAVIQPAAKSPVALSFINLRSEER